MAGTKTCFVIGPIGQPGTDTRKRSDAVLKYVIEPAARDCGYAAAVRADQIAQPGIITVQIIQHLLGDDLVVADLTGLNPNVFYELAVRHIVRKPLVQLIEDGQDLPFDIAPSRVITLNHRDLDSAANAREQLAKHIQAAETNPELVDNPITTAIDLEALRRSTKPHDLQLAEVVNSVLSLQAEIRALKQAMLGAPQAPLPPSSLGHILGGTPGSPAYPWARGATLVEQLSPDYRRSDHSCSLAAAPVGDRNAPAAIDRHDPKEDAHGSAQ
jgi:hypothetical protein